MFPKTTFSTIKKEVMEEVTKDNQGYTQNNATPFISVD